LPSNLPKELVNALKQGLDRDSNNRPGSAREFAGLFRAFLDALPPESSPDVHRLGPAPPTCFGRDGFINAEVAAIRDGIGSPRRARLYHGPGGIGKSTVARQIARHPSVAELFGAERYHVTLDGVASADGVAGKLADAFGLTGPQRLAELDQVLRANHNRLILLDTVDDPLAEAGANVAAQLKAWAANPGVTLLMTSRPDRAPEGAWLVKRPVPPLPEQGIADIFHEFSGNKHGKDHDLSAVLKLAGGMPLAAKLLGWFSLDCDALAEVRDAWNKRGIAILNQSDKDRSLSVARTVRMSLDRPRLQASQPALRLLRLLADLPDGLLLDDLSELLPGDGAEACRVVRSVGGLADEADGRLTVLAPIREEIRSQLDRNRDDWHRAIRFHAEWLRVHGFDFLTKGDETALARFRAEQTNLEFLLRAGIDAGVTETVYGTWGLSLFGIPLGIDYSDLLTDAAKLCKAKEEIRAAAFCYGQIADVLQDRGETEEALRIRREEALPVYERLGDVRAKAITLGQIADVLQRRGETEEALRIRREEELPVYERLGDVREKIICRAKIGRDLIRRGNPEDRPEAREHLEWALAAARKLRLPEAAVIEDILNTLVEE
jgi:tetratricopeptide (TPR) repeat protein